MVYAYNLPDTRYKLSKARAPGAIVQSGVSAPDLLASITRESSPNTTEFSDVSRSYYSIRQDGLSLRNERATDEEDLIGEGKSLRKRFSRSTTNISKRTSMKMPLGLSKSLIFRNGDTEETYNSGEDMSDAARRKAFKEHLAAMSSPSETAFEEEDGYQQRVMSPIRRRSFFTPGLATRNPTDKLAKPPKPVKKPDTEMEYYYSPKCSPFSPLERIAALDLAERPETPTVRASTPGDLDYGLIGRLQITNGVASPVPSSRSSLPRASVAVRNAVDQSDTSPLSSSERHTSRALLQNLLQTGYFRDSWTEDARTQDDMRKEVKPLNHVGASGLSSAWFPPEDEYDSELDKSAPDSASAHKSQDVTTQIAEDYMLGLADNPFGEVSRNSSAQGFRSTTKPNEADADLFDDSSVRRQSTWETDYILPDVADTGDDFGNRTSTLLAQVGVPTTSLAEAMLGIDIDYTALSKADSGYSSGSSIVSVENELTTPRSTNTKRLGTVASKSPTTAVKAKKRPTPVAIPTSTTMQTTPFSNSLQSSTETLATAATTVSSAIESPQVRSPRKLQKSRPRSQPPPSNRCTIQMHLDVEPYLTPSIPNELVTRVAIRLAEVPPLEHTLPSVDHQRDEKIEFDHPPLSAPLRFPSPHREGDSADDHATRAQEKRPKHRRTRSSHFDGLLGYSKGRKSTDMIKSAPHLAHPIYPEQPYDEYSSSHRGPRKYQTEMRTGLASQNQSMASRSKSVGTTLGDSDAAALTTVRAMAKRFDAKPLSETSREPAYTRSDRSPRTAYDIGLSTPDLRGSSSVPTLAAQPNSSRSVDYKYSGYSNTLRSPISSTKIRSPINYEAREIQLQKSRSVQVLSSSPDSKVLPPLPLAPKPKQDRASDSAKGRSSSAEKKLPLLPHQKPAMSRQEDINTLSAYVLQQSPLSKLSLAVQGTTSRHIRMQSEPPHTPVEEVSSTQLYPPQTSTPSHFTQQQYTRSRSVTHIADRINHAEASTHHNLSPSASDPALQHLQGRYTGGLAYNYTRAHGISSSAGSAAFANTIEAKGSQSGLRKSVSISKGFGLDLTDVPIFIYAGDVPLTADGRAEGVGSGGWF